MTASTVKDVVDNLERYYDAFDGEKKSVNTILGPIDNLLSRSVVVETGSGPLDYDGLLKDLDTKLQNGWFMESAEVKQVDKTTIEYVTRIMTHQGTMQTPRYRATIGDDFKITHIIPCNPADEVVPMVTTVDPTEAEEDSVLQKVKAELDQAYNNDDDVSALSS